MSRVAVNVPPATTPVAYYLWVQRQIFDLDSAHPRLRWVFIGLFTTREALERELGRERERSHPIRLVGADGMDLDPDAFVSPRRRHTWSFELGNVGHPHYHRARRHYRSWRHPRTLAEARQNDLVLAEDGEPGPRASRRRGHLPTAYDDIARRYSRSWKDASRRRKQWERR
jgi:hypothetical protein